MSDSMDGTPLAQDNRTLISNLDRLHTTVMGTERIKRNLNIETDAVAYCKALILKRNCVIYQQGKNWYCGVDGVRITIHARSYTIITAHTERAASNVLRFMENSSAVCAAEAERMAGILLFSKEPGELCFLAVDPACRRQHIAQKLVSFMLTQMEEGKDISLITYQESDPNGQAARAFYKRLGFSESRLTEEFGHPAQEFVLKRQTTGQT